MLKKDMLELFLLKIIANEDKYGYEIIRLLHSTFPDTQESAIYAQLRGLCQQGCTESYAGQISGGPTRKYYRLTPLGRKKLQALLDEWQQLCDFLAQLEPK